MPTLRRLEGRAPTPLRVGLVGTGAWAVDVHGRGAAGFRGAVLAGVWGRDPGRTEAAAVALGTAPAPSFGALLDGCDVVTLAVPPDVQVPLAVQAAAAGRHLLLEKPVGLDPSAAALVVSAVERAGVASVVLLTRLFAPVTAAWAEAARAAGGWRSGRVELVAALGAERLAASPWRATSGALWDVGPHALSLLERVLGPVTDVRAAEHRGAVSLLLRHESGPVSTAELSLTAPPSAARTDAAFWGDPGRTPPLPVAGVPDAVLAHRAALAHLLAQAASGHRDRTTDAAYGAHLTALLAHAEAQLCARP